jgi:nuclear transport factor 2 (NTF2) superfamily protein
MAEKTWNMRDPEKLSLAYTEGSLWRNRAEFVQGREAIVALLKRKWARELGYLLVKELRGFRENRMTGVGRGIPDGRDASHTTLPGGFKSVA